MTNQVEEVRGGEGHEFRRLPRTKKSGKKDFASLCIAKGWQKPGPVARFKIAAFLMALVAFPSHCL